MKSKLYFLRYAVAFGVCVFGVLVTCQTIAESLVAPGAEVKKLRGDFSFIEGPTADGEGNIFFSDIPENKIYKWSVEGELSLFRENSGGANGLLFDGDGNLFACEGIVQRVTSQALDGTYSTVSPEHVFDEISHITSGFAHILSPALS
ncbi:MAG TPA: hypothetical protein EYN96_09090, partial [Candidatus Hydrogenedentes bacterium]|nr:hypothetical protein [Candidatus Hydrogenedentota bacterium]